MENKVRDFVYLNTNRYVTIDNLKWGYWGTSVVLFYLGVIGFVSRELLPILFVIIYSILYWVFVTIIQSTRIKKTFELRFLVNGIATLFWFSLFLMLLVTICCYSDLSSSLGPKFVFYVIAFYILFFIIYFIIIIKGIHKGIFSRIKEIGNSRKYAGFLVILPCGGSLGMSLSRLTRTVNRPIHHIIAVCIMICVNCFIGLGYINFLQYYYCKKMCIRCDELGNTFTKGLEQKSKLAKPKDAKQKKILLIKKIFIAITLVLVTIFILLLTIGIVINV